MAGADPGDASTRGADAHAVDYRALLDGNAVRGARLGIVRSCCGRHEGADAVFEDARAIRDGGGNGSIIGRNSFQRSRPEALAMLTKLVEIYKGRA
jgi:DhnA family fructose-bisphosphate aldolase class Ia